MTKAEALSEVMYDLKFKDSVDFEADDKSYSINRVLDENKWFQGWQLAGENMEPVLYENKTDLKKAVSKLGKNILPL